MAATIAICEGHDSSRVKRVTRLGSKCAYVQANTWRTFAEVTTWADGSVRVSITRDGEAVHSFELEAEGVKA